MSGEAGERGEIKQLVKSESFSKGIYHKEVMKGRKTSQLKLLNSSDD
jgi:hypothetical protein